MGKMELYAKLPMFMQNAACTLEGWRIKNVRYDKGFWSYLETYERLAKASTDERISYRNKKINEIVEYAYRSVPYYHRLLDQAGVDPKGIKTLEDLSKIPISTKNDFRKNPQAFVSTEYKGKKVYQHTSGSTGSSLMFYSSPSALQAQWACCWRYRRALGIEFGTLQAVIGNTRIVPKEQTEPPFWRFDRARNQVYFSGFHESEDNLASYCEEIDRLQIPWIHSYPSVLTPLASYMVKNGVSLPSVRHITLSAENLLDHQVQIIQKAFGVSPRQHYSMTEGAANFSENAAGEMYVDEEYAAVEFLESREGLSSVIGTSLNDYITPFIRWNVGDQASCSVGEDGRRRILSLDGRLEDSIIGSDGARIGRLSHVFKDTEHFIETQIYQHADKSITIYVVTDGSNPEKDEIGSLSQLQNSVGFDIPIHFEYVDKIERTQTGKLRAVISEAR